MNFIITPLRWIIDLLYSWVGSYSIAIILFTLVVKLILLPLDIKQRHSMRKMQLIQPKVDEINKKYEKDPEKRSAKTMELYKKEKCNPMSGCLPMLIQMPILFAMFAVMRHIAGEQAVLMVQSLLLAVTAGAKLWLYISRFGFTPLRLLSAWGVLVLAAGCVFVLLSLSGRKNGFRNWLALAVLSFALLCFY